MRWEPSNMALLIHSEDLSCGWDILSLLGLHWKSFIICLALRPVFSSVDARAPTQETTNDSLLQCEPRNSFTVSSICALTHDAVIGLNNFRRSGIVPTQPCSFLELGHPLIECSSGWIFNLARSLSWTEFSIAIASLMLLWSCLHNSSSASIGNGSSISTPTWKSF